MINRILKAAKRRLVAIIRNELFAFQATGFALAHERELVDFQPDIVQCHDWQTLELGVRMKRRTGAKLAFDSHELETHRNPPMPKSKRDWVHSYEARHLPHADLVTTVAPLIARYLEREYAIVRPQVVYNAPFARSPDHAKAQRVARWGRDAPEGGVRAELKLPSDRLLMVMIGNVTHNRGFETIVEALPLVPAHIDFACVGRIAATFEPIIKELTHGKTLEDRIHFLRPVHPEDVVDYIASADVALVPLVPATLSYELALPNKLFEAAFADLPVIAADTYEVARLVERHELGMVFRAGDAPDCAAAINRLSENWTGPGSLKRNNRGFRDAFDFANHSETFAGILDG